MQYVNEKSTFIFFQAQPLPAYIIMKGQDLENFRKNLQNGVKLRYYHIFLLSKLKKLILVDFFCFLFQVDRALKVA